MMKGLFHTTNILLAGLLAGYYMVNFAASTLQDGKPSESCREAETSFGVPKFLAGQWNNELGSRMTILPTSVFFVKNSIVMEHLKWDYVILLQLTNNECHEHRGNTVVNGNCAIIF